MGELLNKVTIILFISLAILILELAICILFFLTKHRKKEHLVIVFYTIFTVLSILILGALVVKISGKNYLSLRLFTIVEGVLLIYYLYLILQNIFAKRALIASGLLFLGFAVFDLFSSQDTDTFDSIPTVIECIIIIGFSMFYFYEQLKNPQSLFLYSTPNFWIVVGLIIFFAGNFFIFIYAQSNSDSAEFKATFSLINAILSFIENILFLIAFIIARQQSKTIKSNIVAKTT